jgi:hypothetical protein
MSEPKRRATTHALREIDRGSGLELFEKIVADLRTLMMAEFERGIANAASRMLQVGNDAREHISGGQPGETIKRAPRGAARALVEEALGKRPMTIREIRDTAKTPMEKFLSYQTIRLELQRGQKSKKYRKSKDKWSLA